MNNEELAIFILSTLCKAVEEDDNKFKEIWAEMPEQEKKVFIDASIIIQDKILENNAVNKLT